MAKEVVEAPAVESTPVDQGGSVPEAQSAPVDSGAPDASPVDGQAQAAVAAAVAQYTPSLKYKFLEQEKEFNPLLKELVKTPEVEKVLKELHEKSEGLDFIKPKFHETREKLKEAETKYTSIQKEIEGLGGMIRQGDLDSFFDAIQLPPAKVYQWVLQKLNEQEMAPEQRAVYQQAREEKKRAALLEQQLQEQKSQNSQTTAHARSVELNMALQRPDVKPFVDAFDAQFGKNGAFFDEVKRQGEYAWYTAQQDISVDQAIQQVMEKFGKVVSPQAVAPQPLTQAAPPKPLQEVQVNKPVIPNIQGKGGSPAKRTVKSIEDLKQIRAAMEAN